MKVLKYIFGIPGAILVILAFFLPWVNDDFFVFLAGITMAQFDLWLWVIFGTGILALLALLFSSVAQLEKAPIVTGVTLIVSGLMGYTFLYLRAAAFLVESNSATTVMVAARDLFQARYTQSAGIGLYLLFVGLFFVIIAGIFSFAPTGEARPTDVGVSQIAPRAITPSPFPVQHNSKSSTLSKETVADAPPTIPDRPSELAELLPTIEAATGRYDSQSPQTIIFSSPPVAGAAADGRLVSKAPAQAKIFAWLIAREVQGLPKGQSFTITAKTFTIGRGAENILQLSDSSVSTRHAEIRQQGNNFSLHDLKSSNGTLIFDPTHNDWVQIDQVQLKDGDQIRFGRSVFSFINVKN